MSPVVSEGAKEVFRSWVATMSKTPFFISQMDGNRLVSVDTSGTIRAYELSTSTIAASFESWRKMIAGRDGQTPGMTSF